MLDILMEFHKFFLYERRTLHGSEREAEEAILLGGCIVKNNEDGEAGARREGQRELSV